MIDYLRNLFPCSTGSTEYIVAVGEHHMIAGDLTPYHSDSLLE